MLRIRRHLLLNVSAISALKDDSGYPVSVERCIMSEIVSSPLSTSDVPRINKAAEGGPSPDGLRCPACQHVSRPGELLCSSCGHLLVEVPKFNLTSTNLLEANADETFKCPGCQ